LQAPVSENSKTAFGNSLIASRTLKTGSENVKRGSYSTTKRSGAPERLFILTRRDLWRGQRVVQPCDALAELLRQWSNDPWIAE